MKTLSTIISIAIISLFTISSAFSTNRSQIGTQETCDCSKDLAFMNAQIREMTSFKKQIKGERLELFNETYASLKRRATSTTPILECYQLLNTLLVQVEDKHAHIKHNVNKVVLAGSEASAKENFRESEAFKKHPITDRDLTALTVELANKPQGAFEGIYHYGNEMEVGIIAAEEGYDVIVLTSETEKWAPGHLHAQITAAENDMYNVLLYDAPGGKMTYIRSLFYFDTTLWNYRKNKERSVALVLDPSSDWEFKQLNADTQYVYFGSWSNRDENVAAFETFYETYKDQFTAKNIIVDLRNNGGGNSKYSNPFYKIFKKNKMNVYVVTNFWSGSNSEQFTIKLKGLKNTTHLGQRTYGAVAYGSNYGRYMESPSGLFSLYPTDMNFHKWIDYEYTGVQPEVALNYDSDWIDQTLQIIAARK